MHEYFLSHCSKNKYCFASNALHKVMINIILKNGSSKVFLMDNGSRSIHGFYLDHFCEKKAPFMVLDETYFYKSVGLQRMFKLLLFIP